MIAYDYQGYGRSEGTRSLIENTDKFTQDGIDFVQKARTFYKEKYPGVNLKFIAYGISLGASVALAVHRSLKTEERFDAFVLTVPSMGTDPLKKWPEEK